MPHVHSTTFSACRDNAAAAKAFMLRLKAEGHPSELLEIPDSAVQAARAAGAPSPPVAVAHSVPADVVVPIAIDVEEDFLPEEGQKYRPSASSPTGPFGGPRPDGQ